MDREVVILDKKILHLAIHNCLESKCNMHLSEIRHSKENGWAYIVSSAVCFDRLDMSHFFYSLNVTQEGTDVNGFWANGQPMKIM